MTDAAALIASERARAHELLALGGLADGWTEETAVPDAESMGALDAFRLASSNPPARISVYIYRAWGQGLDPGMRLQELVDGDQYYARTTTNGRLLAVGITDADSDAGRERIDATLSALAGWE